MNNLEATKSNNFSTAIANDSTQNKSNVNTQFVDNRKGPFQLKKGIEISKIAPIQRLEQDLESQDWDSLLGQAKEAQTKFSDIFEQLIYSGVAPLKGKKRATQKAEEKYKGNYSQILDVVRGTLTFTSFKKMIKGMKIVLANENLGYKVVRCKQTYQTEDGKTGSQTLYGDIKMNIQEAETGHVCEVQFTLKDFLDVKQKGHHAYEEMRTHNPFGDKVLDAQKGKDNSTKGHITKAVHGSYAAYTKARMAIEKDASGLAAAIAEANAIQKQLNE